MQREYIICNICVVRQGHWSIADAILKEDVSGSKQVDSSGRTALMIASLEGHLGKMELFSILLSLVSDENINALN